MRTLIEQARHRQHRRRIVLAVVVVALCAAAGIAYGLESGGSGARKAAGSRGFATVVRAGTRYVVVKPSTGQVIRLCLAAAPRVKFAPAPTSHSGWVAESRAAVREWVYSGPVTACKR
ncbi:MAG TPA: hypothetical protein VHS03_00315 [Gaiellaceae bacterium]|jgi:hypothetical protein|nr:hypothetical protein [Gaiellaceae bacterium]